MTHRSLLRTRILTGLTAGLLATTVVAGPAQATSLAAAPAAPASISSFQADTFGPSTAPPQTPVENKSTSEPEEAEKEVSQDTNAAGAMWWLITAIAAIALASMFFMMRRRRGSRE